MERLTASPYLPPFCLGSTCETWGLPHATMPVWRRKGRATIPCSPGGLCVLPQPKSELHLLPPDWREALYFTILLPLEEGRRRLGLHTCPLLPTTTCHRSALLLFLLVPVLPEGEEVRPGCLVTTPDTDLVGKKFAQLYRPHTCCSTTQ